jgi:hypothetical protein
MTLSYPAERLKRKCMHLNFQKTFSHYTEVGPDIPICQQSLNETVKEFLQLNLLISLNVLPVMQRGHKKYTT